MIFKSRLICGLPEFLGIVSGRGFYRMRRHFVMSSAVRSRAAAITTLPPREIKVELIGRADRELPNAPA